MLKMALSATIFIGILVILLVVIDITFYGRISASYTSGITITQGALDILNSLYLFFNTVVIVILLIGLWFTRSQLQLADRSRKAEVFLRIRDQTYEDRVSLSIKKMSLIITAHSSSKTHLTVGEYTHFYVLMPERQRRADLSQSAIGSEFDRTIKEASRYADTLAIVNFVDDIGSLILSGYVDESDIISFLGSIVRGCDEVFGYHIQFLREESGSTTSHAHAIYLMEKVKHFYAKGFAYRFESGDYRLP